MALTSGDEQATLSAASDAIDAVSAHLTEALPPLLVQVIHAAGSATGRKLVKELRTAIGNGNNQYTHSNPHEESRAAAKLSKRADRTGDSADHAAAATAHQAAAAAHHAAFSPTLADIHQRAADRHAKLAVKGLQLRAAKDEVGWRFDVTNPAATEWASQNAADLVSGISKSTRDDIKDLVEHAFEDQVSVDDLATEIEALIGDPVRAELIARTETMRAANEGQLEAWEQATEEGLLTGDEQKEWIVTPDDRLCPICEAMDGVIIPIDEDFDVDGDLMEGPPAHPNCRCTLGLSLATP